MVEYHDVAIGDLFVTTTGCFECDCWHRITRS